MRIWYWITVATGLVACSEEDKTSTVSPTAASSTSTATQATESPTPKPVSEAELEQRRAQAVKQTNALRDSINQVAGIMPMESSEGPIPSKIPGTTVHDWTPADSEALNIDWSPSPGRGGSTYAQFEVVFTEDETDFTVTATTDLDGDGVTSTIVATKAEPANIQDPSIW